MQITDGKPYIAQVKSLLEEYISSLGRDLNFQGIEEELSDPAAKYTPPEGKLLVALKNGIICGMMAYHRHSDERCEMKRLYVRPAFRGRGLRRLLSERIIADARSLGFREMLLDTLPFLREAIALYRSLGFEEVAQYNDSPMSDAIYLRLTL